MNNQINLLENLNTSQILVGLDLGTKTLGVAVSDRLKIIASPLSTILRKGTKKDLLKLQDILKDYKIGGFIVGLPLSLDNSENQKTQLVRNFNKELINFFNLPSVFWDERFSTDVIFKEMRKSDMSKTKIKNKLDQQSASYILQGYLERYRKNK
ncbi:MAG: Holliday junction resolvase RuvX [Alphaproteobacteria bacterium]